MNTGRGKVMTRKSSEVTKKSRKGVCKVKALDSSLSLKLTSNPISGMFREGGKGVQPSLSVLYQSLGHLEEFKWLSSASIEKMSSEKILGSPH